MLGRHTKLSFTAASILLSTLTHPYPLPQLYQAVDITHPDTGAHTTSLILGLVKYIHVRTDVLNERGLVDLAALRPVGRGGDITYTRVGDAFRLSRPAWSDEAERARAVIQGDVSGAGGKL